MQARFFNPFSLVLFFFIVFISAIATAATLSATLLDKEVKARSKSATVDVRVDGFELVDPDKVKMQVREGQGHLHYQVDNGPIIATTTPKLSFHDLSLGTHHITVTLVGNDHQPVGPKELLSVVIP